MGLLDFEVVENADRVVDGATLRIFVDRVRNVGGGISSRIISDAAVAAGEIAHLQLPGAIVAGEFMNEQDRPAGAAVFIIKLHLVVRGQIGHGSSALLNGRSPRVRSRLRSSSRRFPPVNSRTPRAPPRYQRQVAAMPVPAVAHGWRSE